MIDNRETLDYLRKVTAALQEAKQRLKQFEDRRHEPIAVVSMACRFPGGVESPEGLWRLLAEERDAITTVPRSRWDVDAFFSADPSVPGKTYSRWGGFVGNVSEFDPTFFGMGVAEAKTCDPQQRLLLETTWEAVERAGLTTDDLMGSPTGVFVGISGTDYQTELVRSGAIDTYGFLGTTHSTIVGRISYWLGLRGPNAAVDTACSSSLVALHMAVQALRNGECDMALAGGVNVLISPWGYLYFSKVKALSPTGRCRTFSADADGFVRAEGCGIILLKRLSDAQRAGDTIFAVIRGSAVNQDGRSNGFTAPSGPAQEEVIRRALANARIEPASVHAAECHGTGTSLGDPIEVQALAAVYGQGRSEDRPLVLGSVKTNLGHPESAAGIAGVMKAALSLHHEKIPRSLHFTKPNPHIPWEELNVRVATAAMDWPRGAEPRRISVSSFGISGTNAHLILEEAPITPPREPAPEASSYVLPISAKTDAALETLARSHAAWLAALAPNTRLGDFVYTASVRRTHHVCRLAVTGSTPSEMSDKLIAYFEGNTKSGEVTRGVAPAGSPPRVVFVYSGQGSQWAGMGRSLLAEESVFRDKVDEIDALLRPLVGWSVRDELSADDSRSRLTETEVVQPALFALQVALSALLESWGISPGAVVGHSIGEAAAAHVSGALSLEQATRLVALRGRLMQRATGRGKMVWVALPRSEATDAIRGRESELGIAAVNDPASVVLSGASDALDEVVASLTARGVQCRPLRVSYAFHSPQMTALAEELAERLGPLSGNKNRITMVSTVTGAAIEGRSLDAAYWRRNVRDPVDLVSAVQVARASGGTIFLEVGPHPVLTANLQQCLTTPGQEARVLFTLRRDGNERRALLSALGGLYAHGHRVSFEKLFPKGGQVVRLPAYPFQRERHWLDPAAHRAPEAAGAHASDGHPLLGRAMQPARLPLVKYWEQALGLDHLPYLGDHRVQGEVVFPGTGYIEMALSAARDFYETDQVIVERCQFERMLVVPQRGSRVVQVSIQDEEGRHAFIEILSRDSASGDWVRFASMTVRTASRHAEDAWRPPSAIVARCATVVDRETHYTDTERRGFGYGSTFRGLQGVWAGASEAVGRIQKPALDDSGYQFHPALLDACLQVSAALFVAAGVEGTFVPAAVAQVLFHQSPSSEIWAHVSHRGTEGPDTHVVDIQVTDEDGQPLIDLVALRLRRATAVSSDAYAGTAFSLAWLLKPLRPASPAQTVAGTWVLLSDRTGVGALLGAHLRALGGAAIEVLAGDSYAALGEGRYEIDPSKTADYQRLLKEVVPQGVLCRGVVHLWGLDVTAHDATTSDTLLADSKLATLSVIRVVQAIVGRGFRDSPRLCIVTRGAVPADGANATSSACAYSLWGLGRVIAAERPEVQCLRVDLDGATGPTETEALARELLSSDGEDQVAFRATERLVARLTRGEVEPAPAVTFDGESTYLITGGLGGLGLHVAKWMSSRGAKNLVLVGRRAPSGEAAASIAAMEETGARVLSVSADITVPTDVTGLLSTIQATMPPLRGVIHAAGVLADRTLLDMDEDSFWPPVLPKMLGAWNLHTATRGSALDFFVLYSSAAAVFGSPGQGNYAVANSFLDGLSHHRVALGLPSMSIQWGPFSEVGMAASMEKRGQRLSLRGVQAFSPDDGTELLSRLLQRPRTEMALARLSVRQLFDFYPRLVTSPLFELIRDDESQSAPPLSSLGGKFRDELFRMRPSERRKGMERRVSEQLARVLGMPSERVDPNATLQSLGLDSLMSLEGKDRLEADLGLRLSPAILYTYTTVTALVGHLLSELRLDTTDPVAAEGPGAAPPDIWDEVSVNTAVAMLEEKVNTLEELLK